MTSNSVALWTADETQTLPATVKTAPKIIEYAIQLSSKDRSQIATGFDSGTYEMTMSYVWTKAMATLKRDLARVGMKFLGEILGKGNFEESTNPTTAISHDEAIMLAQEFGVVNATEAMRLRHAYELISHFVDSDGNDLDLHDVMDESEAVQALRSCVKNILGKQKIEVSTQFAEFRSALETKVFQASDPAIETLLISPYFFRKITLGILISLAKNNKGAQLENALANLNVILPLLWAGIRDGEKWAVGAAYAEAYSAGAQTASAGLKSALLKVKGFDFVPENVRSHTFAKAGERLLQAHEQANNYYNEPVPMRELRALGSTIPVPALPICATAVLCVRLGNLWGTCHAAQPDATAVLAAFTQDRWEYYLNQCLPGEARILHKLSQDKPIAQFIALTKELRLNELTLAPKVQKLLEAAVSSNPSKVKTAADQLRAEYYGKLLSS